MARRFRFLHFDGLFETSVLGTFRIVRGFASLKALAEVSVPYEMVDAGDDVGVSGQQRTLDHQHAERIKRYLENGEQRFLPEVILSVRHALVEDFDSHRIAIGVASAAKNEDGIKIGRRWRSLNIRVHRVTVDRTKLDEVRERKLIRRVDGNHRLALAENLVDDPALASKYLAPFCMVLLGPVGDAADDYSESLIFHTINSTALPLESEHALKLILGQHADYDMSSEKEFAYSPDLHFTRLLRDAIVKLPEPVRSRLGRRPLTSIRGAVRGLLDMDPLIAKDMTSARKYSKAWVAALSDIVTRLEPNQPALCKAEFFIELAARVWQSAPGNDHNARVNACVVTLEQVAAWLGRDGLVELKEGQSLSKQVLDIFSAVRNRVPRNVFLARWYPKVSDGEELVKANLRLKQVRSTLKEIEKEEGAHLELVDMGTQTGSTFPIHARMYDAIASADIILVDLTGARPNVCVEAGFALRHHEKSRLIFMFQPTDSFMSVPFDLNTFRYEIFKDTGEIPEKIKPHINSILRGAAIGN